MQPAASPLSAHGTYGLFFGVLSRLAAYVRECKKLGFSPVLSNFVSGGFAATTLWCVAFPTDLIKNRMMSQPDVKPRRYEVCMQPAATQSPDMPHSKL
jgi:hypothetical protein